MCISPADEGPFASCGRPIHIMVTADVLPEGHWSPRKRRMAPLGACHSAVVGGPPTGFTSTQEPSQSSHQTKASQEDF